MGAQVETPVLTPEPGDIWPGPLPPEPTLQELEQQGQQSGPERPVPGSPQFEAAPPPNLPPPRPHAAVRRRPDRTSRACRKIAGPDRPDHRSTSRRRLPIRPGRSTRRNRARRSPPAVPVAIRLSTTPGGGSAIVVPNGNGTSTIIHSDGKIETVPTPR